MFVASVIQHVARRRRLLSSAACLALPYYFINSTTFAGGGRKLLNQNCVLISCTNFARNISRSKNNSAKWSRYRPGVAQTVGTDITLLFHDRGTRRGWVVSRTPRPHFTPGKDPLPIVQEAGWAPGPVWTGGKSRPHRDLIPDIPARSQSLYRLSYRGHNSAIYHHIYTLVVV